MDLGRTDQPRVRADWCMLTIMVNINVLWIYINERVLYCQISSKLEFNHPYKKQLPLNTKCSFCVEKGGKK